VDDVSFELKRGECLGLIGHNGAGKSTLLKMLNGLIKPDKGSITMKGRIGALIELGAGFNPILTGRENIYNNGAVLGFSRKEIDKKFDAIVDFAEIGDFIDTPVQNYSSGMKVRLGFAVAAQMEPDVLLIDEVLAVGDVGFRAKCFSRIGELQNNSSIIFVSHAMNQISRISTTLIHMHRGEIAYQGSEMSKGIDQFLNGFNSESYKALGNYNAIRIEHFLLNGNNAFKKNFKFRQFEKITIDFQFTPQVKNKIFGITFTIFDQELKGVAAVANPKDNNKVFVKNNLVTVKASFTNQLAPGKYFIAIHINKYDDLRPEFLTEFRQVASLLVTGSQFYTLIPIHLESHFE
jgi:lipopolysaccharide transport system ATP-binding protein